jgi:hypothetical protein
MTPPAKSKFLSDAAMKRLDPASAAACDLASGRYRIRAMTVAELDAIAITWMRDAGWNPGLHDAATFHAADPEGFLVGLLEGEPIACLSAVAYGDAFGFFGCYIVRADHRGRGYGMALHEAGRARLAGRLQGGDGVLENVARYEQIGRIFAYRNARFEGTAAPAPRSPHLAPLQTSDWADLLALDAACFPAPREGFLRAFLTQPDATALVHRTDGALDGVGLVRRCGTGWKVGPLFARSPEAAAALYDGLTGSLPTGSSFYLDIPEPNEAARALVARHGLREVFATARMYTGKAPQLRLDWVYGVTTFELG